MLLVSRFRYKKRYPLTRTDADFMNEYYDTPETGSASVPKYYAQWDQGTLVLAPTQCNI